MAYRDLTPRFATRRRSLASRNRYFRLNAMTTGMLLVDAATSSSPFAVFKGKKRSRGLEKSLLQEDPHDSEVHALERGGHSPEDLKPEWTRFADQANDACRLLRIKMEYLQVLHMRRLMVRFDESEQQQEVEIDQVTDEISTLFQHADRNLKRITTNFVGGEPCKSAAERRVRVNSQRAIASRLSQLSSQFRSSQHEYLTRLKQQKYGLQAFAFDDNQDDCFQVFEDFNWSNMHQQKQKPQFMDLRSFQISTRDTEIQRISQSVVLLSSVFKEVASLVIDQGTLIDRIDYNMEQVVQSMRTGFKELQAADRFQRNTRPERCIRFLLTCIAVCFVILLAKHSS